MTLYFKEESGQLFKPVGEHSLDRDGVLTDIRCRLAIECEFFDDWIISDEAWQLRYQTVLERRVSTGSHINGEGRDRIGRGGLRNLRFIIPRYWVYDVHFRDGATGTKPWDLANIS